jgi:transcriptional regulator with XRE-family HTH domain
MYDLRVSQRELARRIQVSQPWVQARLAGETTITVADIERIAAALGVPVSRFLPDTEPATDSPATAGAGGRGTGASVPAGDGRQGTGLLVPGHTRTSDSETSGSAS